jgi:hypothetical protein
MQNKATLLAAALLAFGSSMAMADKLEAAPENDEIYQQAQLVSDNTEDTTAASPNQQVIDQATDSGEQHAAVHRLLEEAN